MTGKTPRDNERDGVDGFGRTPLHYAAADNDPDELRRILSEGADPNIQDDNGWTALHFASQSGSVACVRLLLSVHANPELRDSFGNTALWRAVFASNGDGEIIKMLREAGADALAKNNHGVSPVALARTIANRDLAQFFTDIN